ncbi:hypothetical protein VHUM_04080 [Vanrija humicola]|uniref:Major facilitator superfamily (MFS) profile domain-containing protein n=1 Tax=Vanrija humicola TaxID=5417 RepID=A0A7D8UXK0_VANHU|nr:hypothetical protein VHUM_04080 [Vanrija humicola]
MSDLEKRPADTHLEKVATNHPAELLKSRYDNLSIPKTLVLFKRSVFFVLMLYTGYMCEGFELGAGGSIIANKGFIKQFSSNHGNDGDVRKLNPTWVATWAAMLNVGQILVFTHIGWVADRFGRKIAFYMAWVWLMVGCAFFNTAKTPAVWALAKLCNGAGVGVLQICAQVYVMEIVPNRIRGGLITFQAVWSTIGGIIVSVMMQQLNKKHPENYMLPMRILWAPIGLIIICWAILPESPWYYARQGNKEKALKAMKQLYGGIEGYDFEEEYGIIERTIEHEREINKGAPTYRDVFRGVNLKRTLSVAMLSACQQLAGLAIIRTYSTCEALIISYVYVAVPTLTFSCVNLLAVTLWSLSTDKLGRRVFVTWGQTFCCVVLFLVGALYYAGATKGNAAAGTGLLVVCCFWTFTFQIIIMSYYLYSAELPSALLRVKTGPFTFLVNSILGIATCYATPPMLLKLNIRAGFIYGAFSVPLCILMWYYLPETKGRSAAEIDELYERKIPAWRWSKTVTEAETHLREVSQGQVVHGKQDA